jgi:hypothetical protein
MDFKKLGNLLMIGGALVLIGAVAWWYSFFSSIVRDVGKAGARGVVTMRDALSCLYSGSDFCGLVSGGARLLGETPYEPKVFWIGLAALIAGVLIRATAKPAGAK